MKDGLFEMLLTLFEKTLTQLKESYQANPEALSTDTPDTMPVTRSPLEKKVGVKIDYVQAARPDTVRVFTPDERLKLSKRSYQFLMRLSSYGVIAPAVMELIVNRLIFSDSRFVSLQETKWTIRNTLAESLDAEQLAFLELVLYQEEDGFLAH